MRIVLFVSVACAGCLSNEFPVLPLPSQGDAGEVSPPILTWPPDGAFGVPPVPELLAVRFEDDAPREIALRVAERDLAFEARDEDCASIGFEGGRCVRLETAEPLPSEGTLGLHVDGALVASMSLGSLDGPPSLASASCAIFERERESFCVDVDDSSARVRGLIDRSARLLVRSAGETRAALAPGGRVDLEVPLVPGCPTAYELEALALDGSVLRAELVLVGEVDLPPLHLVESLPDPSGPEPAQEYVELANLGDARIDLGGFSLTDDPDRRGDVFPEAAFVPPGGRLLLVSRGYDPEDSHDPSPPAGALLLRLDASLGSGGLSNAGEALYLLDPRGRRVSAMPPRPTPSEGSCLVARSVDDRRPRADRFTTGACSPGR